MLINRIRIQKIGEDVSENVLKNFSSHIILKDQTRNFSLIESNDTIMTTFRNITEALSKEEVLIDSTISIEKVKLPGVEDMMNKLIQQEQFKSLKFHINTDDENTNIKLYGFEKTIEKATKEIQNYLIRSNNNLSTLTYELCNGQVSVFESARSFKKDL